VGQKTGGAIAPPAPLALPALFYKKFKKFFIKKEKTQENKYLQFQAFEKKSDIYLTE